MLVLECNAARCDKQLGHCVIGIYDETKGCSNGVKSIYEIKERGTPSKWIKSIPSKSNITNYPESYLHYNINLWI